MKLNAKLIMVNMSSNNPAASQDFYSKLFGIQLSRSLYEQAESYHAPISFDGIDLNINPRHHPSETSMPVFAVDNLAATLQSVQSLGGRALWGPESLPIAPDSVPDYEQIYAEEFGQQAAVSDTMGDGAVVIDPGGSIFGLVQLAAHSHGHFAYGIYRNELTPQQTRIHDKSLKAGGKLKVGARR